MVRLRIELDGETFQHLLDRAMSESRSVPRQAEVLLRQALGLPFPYPIPHFTERPAELASRKQADGEIVRAAG